MLVTLLGFFIWLTGRSGLFGNLFRALNEELQFDYWRFRILHEETEIKQFLERYPAPEEEIMISFVMPVYGIPRAYIKQMIDSLRLQSHRRWELCICLDGEDDRRVKKLVQRLHELEPERFRLVKNSNNEGICSATRKALAMATGEVVSFLDADDLVHPKTAEALSRLFGGHADVDFAYTDNDFLSDSGFRRWPMRKPGWSPELLLQINYINHLTAFRRSTIQRWKGIFAKSVNGAQDWDLCFRASHRARRIVHIPLVLYHWRRRPGSLAHSGQAKPWAYKGALAAKRSYLKTQSKILRWTAEEGLVFKNDIPKKLYPKLIVGIYHSARADGLDVLSEVNQSLYPGRVEVVHVSGSRLVPLIQSISNRRSKNTIAFFLDAKKAVPFGRLEAMVTYALQPNIGCVWPFRDEKIPLAYTLGKKLGVLQQIALSRGVFANRTRNVLTGPLHGMMIETRKLKEALVGISISEYDVKKDAQLGAIVGLNLLAARRRHVSCTRMICDQKLPQVRIPRHLAPEIDPFR